MVQVAAGRSSDWRRGLELKEGQYIQRTKGIRQWVRVMISRAIRTPLNRGLLSHDPVMT